MTVPVPTNIPEYFKLWSADPQGSLNLSASVREGDEIGEGSTFVGADVLGALISSASCYKRFRAAGLVSGLHSPFSEDLLNFYFQDIPPSRYLTYNPFTVTSAFSEDLLKFYFQDIPPSRVSQAVKLHQRTTHRISADSVSGYLRDVAESGVRRQPWQSSLSSHCLYAQDASTHYGLTRSLHFAFGRRKPCGGTFVAFACRENFGSVGMQGQGKRRSLSKPADQRHRPERFHMQKSEGGPAGNRTRFAAHAHKCVSRGGAPPARTQRWPLEGVEQERRMYTEHRLFTPIGRALKSAHFTVNSLYKFKLTLRRNGVAVDRLMWPHPFYGWLARIFWGRISCLIGYCVLEKVPYWLARRSGADRRPDVLLAIDAILLVMREHCNWPSQYRDMHSRKAELHANYIFDARTYPSSVVFAFQWPHYKKTPSYIGYFVYVCGPIYCTAEAVSALPFARYFGKHGSCPGLTFVGVIRQAAHLRQKSYSQHIYFLRNAYTQGPATTKQMHPSDLSELIGSPELLPDWSWLNFNSRGQTGWTTPSASDVINPMRKFFLCTEKRKPAERPALHASEPIARNHLANPITARCGATTNEHITEAPVCRVLRSVDSLRELTERSNWLDRRMAGALQCLTRKTPQPLREAMSAAVNSSQIHLRTQSGPRTPRERASMSRLSVRVVISAAILAGRSPPIKANRVQSPAGSPDFRKWESCRTMPLVGGFSRGLPIPPPLHSGAAPQSLQSPSSALKTSLLRAVQISSLHSSSILVRGHWSDGALIFLEKISGLRVLQNTRVQIHFRDWMIFNCHSLRPRITYTQCRGYLILIGPVSQKERDFTSRQQPKQKQRWLEHIQYCEVEPDANLHIDQLRGVWTCASNVNKLGSDTGDINTHGQRLIAPTRKACSVSVVVLYCANQIGRNTFSSCRLDSGYWFLLRAPSVYSTEQTPAYLATLHLTPPRRRRTLRGDQPKMTYKLGNAIDGGNYENPRWRRLIRLKYSATGRRGNCHHAGTRSPDSSRGDYVAARPRSRSEGAIRATLTRTPSASSLLRARRAVFPSTRSGVAATADWSSTGCPVSARGPRGSGGYRPAHPGGRVLMPRHITARGPPLCADGRLPLSAVAAGCAALLHWHLLYFNLKGAACLELFSAFEAERRESCRKGYTGMRYKSDIAATRKALTWRAHSSTQFECRVLELRRSVLEIQASQRNYQTCVQCADPRKEHTLQTRPAVYRLFTEHAERLEHCTPVQILTLSGDVARDARGNVTFIAPALLSLNSGGGGGGDCDGCWRNAVTEVRAPRGDSPGCETDVPATRPPRSLYYTSEINLVGLRRELELLEKTNTTGLRHSLCVMAPENSSISGIVRHSRQSGANRPRDRTRTHGLKASTLTVAPPGIESGLVVAGRRGQPPCPTPPPPFFYSHSCFAWVMDERRLTWKCSMLLQADVGAA
ncbi:hypothetical protein PR048_029480 [Dryococelus australis]|uniref:Uncharacterized protein n=1 Tax=Dryococelus australis TaxID=614101 RepID=A0ABQ9GDH8_9NEOP|nr:hypothetical protein PR048_029480 [Dryococelus australis]